MELEGLKQNLEEAERIEVQNEDLQRELKETKEMVTLLKEKLYVFELSNSNHLIEVATLREQIRGLEGELEEVRFFHSKGFRCYCPSILTQYDNCPFSCVAQRDI